MLKQYKEKKMVKIADRYKKLSKVVEKHIGADANLGIAVEFPKDEEDFNKKYDKEFDKEWDAQTSNGRPDTRKEKEQAGKLIKELVKIYPNSLVACFGEAVNDDDGFGMPQKQIFFIGHRDFALTKWFNEDKATFKDKSLDTEMEMITNLIQRLAMNYSIEPVLVVLKIVNVLLLDGILHGKDWGKMLDSDHELAKQVALIAKLLWGDDAE